MSAAQDDMPLQISGPTDLSGNSGEFVFEEGLAGTGSLTLGTRTLVLTNAGTELYAGAIGAGVSASGKGSLNLSGAGTQILTGASTFADRTVINSGTLQLGNGGGGGSLAGAIVDDATLALDYGFYTVVSNPITGTGAVNLLGAGTVVYAADETYAGPTAIRAGNLQLGQGGATGGLAGAVSIAAGSTLSLDRGDTLKITDTISGAGGVTQLGGGISQLYAYETYTGDTAIRAGTLALAGNGNIENSARLSIADGAGFDISGAPQYAGIKDLSGTANSRIALGNQTLTIRANGDDVFAGTITDRDATGAAGGGGIAMAGTGTLHLTGLDAYSGRTVVNSGTLVLGNGGAISVPTGAIVDDATLVFDGTASYGGGITGYGRLVQQGGTLTLTAAQAYGGVTTVNGAMVWTDGGRVATGLAFGNGGSLTVRRADTLAYGGAISGAGSLSQAGGGTLSLSGANTYTGGTTIAAGTLELTNGAAGGAGAIAFAPGAGATLLLDTTAPGAAIAGFGIGDVIDIRAVGLADGAAIEGGQLVVSGPSGGMRLNLADPAAYAGMQFTLAGDGNGGTAIRAAPIPTPVVAPTPITPVSTAPVPTAPVSAGSDPGAAASPAPVAATAASLAGAPQFDGAAAQYVVAPDGAGNLDVGAGGGLVAVPDGTALQFADGIGLADPSGTVGAVARLYAAAFDRAPDAAGLEYWAGQAGTVPLPAIAADFVASPEFANDYAGLDDSGFVGRLYQNVLGRPGEDAGIGYWTNALANGAGRPDVLLDFAQSAENKAATVGTAGDPDRAEVTRLYQAVFGRAADAAGLDYWSGLLDGGASPDTVAQAMIDTPEFMQAHAGQSGSDLVQALYGNVLGRAADQAGLDYWTGQLAGGASQASVALGLADSAENRLATAGATHDGWVFVKA